MKQADNRNYTNFELALMNMGYRQPDPVLDANRWAKPIGYNIFIAHVKELLINSHFYAADGKLHCWESNNVKLNEANNPLEMQIATIEQYQDCRGAYNPHHFGFLTANQRAELIVGA